MYVHCMYITAFDALSTVKNFDHQSVIDVEGKILLRVERQVKIVQILMTKADLFLRISEEIPGTLNRFQSLKNMETLWRPLRNGSNTF